MTTNYHDAAALRNAWRSGFDRAAAGGLLDPCPYTRSDLVDAYERGFEWFVQMGHPPKPNINHHE